MVAHVAPHPRRGARSRADAVDALARRLYTALAPSLMPDPRRPGWPEGYLLDACRASLSRLAADPGSHATAARWLFSSARSLMNAHDQLRASQIIQQHFSQARAHFAADLAAAGQGGTTARCAALNRKGKPCGREPIWGTAFCVSHTHRPAGDA